MAPDEYSTGGGGRLKLKGSKVSDGRVEKKKKKKVKKEEKRETGEGETGKEMETVLSRDQSREPGEPGESGDDGREQREREGSAAKTEAERKYEEVRRKRVCLPFFSDGVGLNWYD